MARNPSAADQFPLPTLTPEAFPEEQRETVRAFNKLLHEWFDRLNGRISLGTGFNKHSGHLDGELIEVFTTATGAVDFPVAHNLERVPVGVFQLVSESASPLSRDPATPANSETLVWLRSAAAVGTKFWILVF